MDTFNADDGASTGCAGEDNVLFKAQVAEDLRNLSEVHSDYKIELNKAAEFAEKGNYGGAMRCIKGIVDGLPPEPGAKAEGMLFGEIRTNLESIFFEIDALFGVDTGYDNATEGVGGDRTEIRSSSYLNQSELDLLSALHINDVVQETEGAPVVSTYSGPHRKTFTEVAAQYLETDFPESRAPSAESDFTMLTAKEALDFHGQNMLIEANEKPADEELED